MLWCYDLQLGLLLPCLLVDSRVRTPAIRSGVGSLRRPNFPSSTLLQFECRWAIRIAFTGSLFSCGDRHVAGPCFKPFGMQPKASFVRSFLLQVKSASCSLRGSPCSLQVLSRSSSSRSRPHLLRRRDRIASSFLLFLLVESLRAVFVGCRAVIVGTGSSSLSVLPSSSSSSFVSSDFIGSIGTEPIPS